MISSLAESATVPSTQRSKQKRIASGSTVDSRPISSTTRATLRPRACSSTRATISCVRPSSCMSIAAAEFGDESLDHLDRAVHGRPHGLAQAHDPVLFRAEREQLTADQSKARHRPAEQPDELEYRRQVDTVR